MNKFLLAFFLLLQVFSSLALSSTSHGKVIEYWVHNGGDDNFLFMVENQQGRPACASFGTPNGRYAVSMRTEKGKMIAASIIAAEASKATVYVHGMNVCNQWPDAEDIHHISVK